LYDQVRQFAGVKAQPGWSQEFLMKALPIAGALLLILGVLSFVVPVPHQEKHGLKVGDANFSVQTESSEKLPPAVGIILIGGGVLALILGLRKA
jgi:preprotein translocase subunit Sss1